MIRGDPRHATSINNLAYALHANGQYHDRPLISIFDAKSIREAVTLGRDHPDVAETCNNLGELYRLLGRL